MAVEASSSSHNPPSLLVDDLYFSVLPDVFPISDEKFAEELQLQEAIASSLSTSAIAMANNKRAKGECSRSRIETSVCRICTDTKSAGEMFTIRGCSHSFCGDCISKHIAVKLEENMAVKCPEVKCGAALEPETCGSLVPKEVLERWGDVLVEAMVLKRKRLNCPFEDCSAMMIDEGEEAVTAAECPSCRRMFCAQCKVGWHGEMKCEEFKKLIKEGGNRDDVMTMKLADRKNWKRCPFCKIYVEKIGGCLHIHCRCGSEFCYGCGSKWDINHKCSPSAYERVIYRG